MTTAKTEGAPQARDLDARSFNEDGQYGSGNLYEDGKLKNSGTNAIGNRTVSVLPPSGGKDGDIWYQVA